MPDWIGEIAASLGPVGLTAVVVIWIMLKYGPGAKEQRDEEPYAGPDRRSSDPCVVSPDMKNAIYDMKRELSDIHSWLDKEDPQTMRKLIYFPSSFEESLRDFTKAIESLTLSIERMRNDVD